MSVLEGVSADASIPSRDSETDPGAKKDAKQQRGSHQSKQPGAGSNSTATTGTGSEEDDEEDDGAGGSAGGSVGSESEEEDAQAAIQAVVAALAGQLPQMPNMPEGQSSPIPSNGIFQPGEDLSKQLVEEAARVLAEETARIASHVSQMEGQGDEGSVSYNSGYVSNISNRRTL